MSPEATHTPVPERNTSSMTIAFDQRTAEILDDLKRDFGASSKAEIIRKAIALLDIARDARNNGGKLTVTDAAGVDHAVMF